ncbi:hypothetical protein CJ030_MR4G028710 [Morella rubra]|uniref:Uncharacterized protein n=1 Tax=Morella rubra TaxID=262757 RepID=A0A6A1VV63_9ROSI|nr:hypothetical protein CJ030_MR4G028710 [Morella rubra]
MAASLAAGRSTLVRAMSRTSKTSSFSYSVTRGFSVPTLPSNFVRRQAPIFPPPPLKLILRELASLKPVHSAIASACLVSKLPSEASTSTEALDMAGKLLGKSLQLVFLPQERSKLEKQKQINNHWGSDLRVRKSGFREGPNC